MPESARFDGFFDDAAVFPPGSAPLPRAVRDHLLRRSTPLNSLVGPLLLPAKELANAAGLADEVGSEYGIDLSDSPLRVGLVVAPDALEAATETVAAAPATVSVVALEVKTDERWRDQAMCAREAAESSAQQIYVELSAAAVAAGGIDVVQGGRAQLKFRTGGLNAALFPSPVELAEVVAAAVASGIPFKLTAGLHQAVRYVATETGLHHHGFLNIALAVTAAQEGAGAGGIARLLSLEDHDDVRNAFRAAGDAWRVSFESFGTCNVAEPVESLIALGLLDGGYLSPEGTA